MKNVTIILLVLLVCACNNKPVAKMTSNSSENLDKFFTINYEDVLKKKKVVKLSQIASNVDYIKLETTKDCLIKASAKYFFTDSLIFIQNGDHILKFSREGRFLKRIGKSGRGPGEIDLIIIMSILPDERIIVVQKNSQRELLYFSFDGDFIKAVHYTHDVSKIKVLQDGKYVGYQYGASGKENFTFCLMTEKWDTLSVVENYTKWENKSIRIVGVSYNSFEMFYYYYNIAFFKAMYNDTIYFVKSDRLEPAYYLNLGKYKLPDELRSERLGPNQIQRFIDNSHKYYFGNVMEAGRKIFLASFSYGGSFHQYIIFDRNNQQGFTLTNEDGNSQGLINDWDGGLDFWPVGSINDNQVYMPINILAIQKELDRIKTNKESIKFPEKQQQLIKMISELDPFNNPILMIVTLK